MDAGENWIGERGLELLVECGAGKLRELCLSKEYHIRPGMSLVVAISGESPWANGRSLKNLTWV
jgi:hypothetical protein